MHGAKITTLITAPLATNKTTKQITKKKPNANLLANNKPFTKTSSESSGLTQNIKPSTKKHINTEIITTKPDTIIYKTKKNKTLTTQTPLNLIVTNKQTHNKYSYYYNNKRNLQTTDESNINAPKKTKYTEKNNNP